MAADIDTARQPPAGNGGEAVELDDPFTTGNPSPHPHPHRYSAFDTQLFSLNASSSPGQVKRTLEAHIAETDRRLGDASRLGTTLLDQRKELQEKLQELEQQQDDAELSPELRKRLLELENEYNEVGRDSARAILAPKSRVVSAEEKQPSDSPAHFSTQATASPTKVTAPTRKQRNQTSSRVGDIQFAADISTSLLAQVRQLQGVLAERDDTLRAVTLEKSRLELEAEGFTQRLRALDESEQRYKDENWNLETQTHELMAAAKDSAEREKKLSSTLAAISAEKSRAQNELDELRVVHGKLADDHSAAQKAHDSELHALRRNLDTGDAEKTSLQNRVEELTSQNQELAKAVAARFRARDSEGQGEMGFDHEDYTRDDVTPEHSPPPSPSKGTPRHPGLESETLRSSLHHAHRMIQNLKGNIHREKTEKIELKRMLQETRDELEQARAGTASGSKRQKTKSELFKKPSRLDQLGANRKERTDIEFEDPEWQDHDGEVSPSRATGSRLLSPGAWPASATTTDMSDAYQTANDTDAFETANERERETESEAFQTGAESLAGESSEELTETEASKNSTVRAKRPTPLTTNRMSFQSTASTSADEDEEDVQTPVQSQPQKYRLKLNKFLNQRRSRGSVKLESPSAQSSAKNSPASFFNRSPPPQGQSLFAELDAAGSDGFSTPGRGSIASATSTPGGLAMSASRGSIATTAALAHSQSHPEMVDSGMMTEPWVPSPPAQQPVPDQFPLPPSHPGSPMITDSGTQWTPHKSLSESPSRHPTSFITPPKTVWDEQQEPTTPIVATVPLGLSKLSTQETYPVEDQAYTPIAPLLAYSGISAQMTEPSKPVTLDPALVEAGPVETGPARTAVPAFAFSKLSAQETAPIAASGLPPVVVEEARPPTAKKVDDSRPSTSEKLVAAGAGVGLFGAVGAKLGFRRGSEKSEPVIAEDNTADETSVTETNHEGSRAPLQDISGNPVPTPIKKAAMSDSGAQTLLTSAQIDKALMEKMSPPTSPAPTDGVSVAVPTPLAPRTRSGTSESTASIRRPSSSQSTRQSFQSTHPPLPPDHKQAIVAAGGKVPSETKPERQIMGPPLAPASAYRRPRTPAEQGVSSPTRGGATSRAKSRTGATSQMSRRSSVSSFASELDERFNIRADAMAAQHTFEPGTDPRMIQAITQTMIGEFLWKYTRKAGRGEMSTTRHRRYFWVHPYTKTLYWSDQDPQTAGRNELKAKSVAIEAVRVVTDDNPMPPGLHRKSLEVITPGRKLRFTASTGQRHETWFNALSYLLLRNQEEDGNVNGAVTDGLTAEDVNEFNPGHFNRASGTASHASLSSYNSRTTQNTTVRASSRLSGRQQQAEAIASRPTLAPPAQSQRDSIRRGSMSRLSHIFKGSMGYSTRSRSDQGQLKTPGEEGSNSIYNASLVEDGHDSAEDLRKEMLRQEKEADRLENVRACCDGKCFLPCKDNCLQGR